MNTIVKVELNQSARGAGKDFIDGGEHAVIDQQRAAEALIPRGLRYREQYAVIVMCKDEAEQRRTYNALQRRYAQKRLRVVAT